MPALPFASTGPVGHRSRMRDRLLARGPGGLADYEVLEMLLFLGIPRGDTKPLAKGLINAFGSLGAVLAAPAEELLRRGQLPEDALLPLRLVEAAADRLSRADAVERPLLGSLAAVEAHVRTRPMATGTTRLLFLDNRNRLLGEEDMDDGPSLPVRLVLRRALALHATALLVVDRSDGAPERAAERARGEAARRLAQAGALISIVLHDRLLLAPDSLQSYRALGLFKPQAAR